MRASLRILALSLLLILVGKIDQTAGYYFAIASTAAARELHDHGWVNATPPFFNVALFFAPDAEIKRFVLETRGHAHELAQRPEAALADFNRAVAADPKATYALTHRAFMAANKVFEAKYKSGGAGILNPSQPDIFWAAKVRTKAFADFDAALAVDPKNEYAIIARANLLASITR